MTEVSLPASGRGGREKKKRTLAKYLSCVIKEASVERIRDVLKWGNNGVFKEQAGEEWVEEKHCSLTSTALEQWNKAEQQGGIINSLCWIAGVYLSLVWPNIKLPPAAESLLVWHSEQNRDYLRITSPEHIQSM